MNFIEKVCGLMPNNIESPEILAVITDLEFQYIPDTSTNRELGLPVNKLGLYVRFTNYPRLNGRNGGYEIIVEKKLGKFLHDNGFNYSCGVSDKDLKRELLNRPVIIKNNGRHTGSYVYQRMFEVIVN